jgi:hypothetical protein
MLMLMLFALLSCAEPRSREDVPSTSFIYHIFQCRLGILRFFFESVWGRTFFYIFHSVVLKYFSSAFNDDILVFSSIFLSPNILKCL